MTNIFKPKVGKKQVFLARTTEKILPITSDSKKIFQNFFNN